MKIFPTKIDGLLIIQPSIFEDDRGIFFESFNKKLFSDSLKKDIYFVQDNQSVSKKNVIRGLHYQINSASQSKLVSVLHGKIYDVAVDIRQSSKTFGKWVGVELDSISHRQLWIPEGFAHGFMALSDNAIVSYKVTNYYNKLSERAILWNDNDLKIDWPLTQNPIVSYKDKNANKFSDAVLFY